MAIQSVTQLLARADAIKKGTVEVELSPVQKVLAAKKTEDDQKVDFFHSKTYYAAKSQQLKYMMALYSNLGLSEEYNAVQTQATNLVKEYTKLYGKPETGSTTSTEA